MMSGMIVGKSDNVFFIKYYAIFLILDTYSFGFITSNFGFIFPAE